MTTTMESDTYQTECDDFDAYQSGSGNFTVFPFGNGDDSLQVFCDFEPRQNLIPQPAKTYLTVKPGTV